MKFECDQDYHDTLVVTLRRDGLVSFSAKETDALDLNLPVEILLTNAAAKVLIKHLQTLVAEIH